MYNEEIDEDAAKPPDPGTSDIIELIFNPESVAVIGASTNPIKGGSRILANLLQNKFKGRIYPVNPKGGEFSGLSFYKSLEDIPDPVDIAIVFVPNRFIPDIISECIKKGVKAAIIEAAGFEEVGSSGQQLAEHIRRITDNFGKIRIVGPNCTGVTRIDGAEEGGFFSSFIVHRGYKRGNIAIISQSGMVNGGYFSHLCSFYPDMGVRYIASIGNKTDLDECDFLYYYLMDPEVKVIAIYLETFSRPGLFMRLCRYARKYTDKQIIVLKSGFSRQGQKATLGHTGAIAENSNLADALIRQSRALKATSFYKLFLLTHVFSMMYRGGLKFPEKGTPAFVTVSGGAGAVAADLAARFGLNFPELSESTYKAFKELYPPWMPPNRFALMDLWPAIESAGVDSNGIHKTALELLMSDPAVEGIIMTLFYLKEFPFDIDIPKKIVQKYRKPIFCMMFGDRAQLMKIRDDLHSANIPAFFDLETLMQTFAALTARKKTEIGSVMKDI